MSDAAWMEFLRSQGGRFDPALPGRVLGFGNERAEYEASVQSAALLDLGFRGRLCVTGADRVRFLNGQVTHNVKDLKPGGGCYAALTTAKGKLVSDLFIYLLEEELLLDFEPGLEDRVWQRLEKYIIADAVELVRAEELVGLISLQGPKSIDVLSRAGLGSIPQAAHAWTKMQAESAEIYCMRCDRTGQPGFDFFAAPAAQPALWRALESAGAARAGWNALETARLESGIPRFGADMDESNLPHEAGLDRSAVSFSKGCYTGQEVIARIRTYGQVAKSLCRLEGPQTVARVPGRLEKLFAGGTECGYVTSAIQSPAFGRLIALGYVRREHRAPGTELEVGSGEERIRVKVVEAWSR